MKALSPSKINLTLEILGIKENQYHEISSIMQTLDLSDEMSFSALDSLTAKESTPYSTMRSSEPILSLY